MDTDGDIQLNGGLAYQLQLLWIDRIGCVRPEDWNDPVVAALPAFDEIDCLGQRLIEPCCIRGLLVNHTRRYEYP